MEGRQVSEQRVRGADSAQPQGSFGDAVYQRLLKERIIWLGSAVEDENANAFCAQMLLLAAEDSDRDHWFSAQEAVDYGFAAKIVSTPQEIGPRANDAQNGEN
ncbi:UNVERIFIED_CONTAM: hypothetical protein FO527_31200 [Bacillus sp. ATCC 13368]